MNYRLTLAGVCLLAVFGLAACAGGDDDGALSTARSQLEQAQRDKHDADTAKQKAEEAARQAEAGKAGAETAARLYLTAVETYAETKKAVEDAAQAVADARTNSEMLSTASVAGESADATQNAQDVLDANTAAETAVMEAEDALASAELAEAEAEALAGDNEYRADLIAALGAAIAKAEMQIVAAKASRDGEKLAAAVAKVTGDAEPLKTAADAGKAVATVIAEALADDDQGAIFSDATVPVAPTANQPVKRGEVRRIGKTWEHLAVSLGYTVVWQTIRNPEANPDAESTIGTLSVRAVQIRDNDKDAPAAVVNAATNGVVDSRTEVPVT